MLRGNGSRLLAGLATTVLAVSGPVCLAPTAAAAACDPASATRGDLDGDGRTDVVVGMPWEGDGSGSVDVQYSGAPAREISAGELGGEGEEGTTFGSAVAIGDLDGDGCADLVIGALRERGAGGYQGAVHIVFGGPGGLVDDSFITLPYTASGGQTFDDFGTALALEKPPGDDRRHDLYVGAPGRTVGGRGSAGAVVHYAIAPGGAPGSPDRINVSAPEVIGQDSPGVPGAAEAGDRFGEVLTAGRYRRGVVAAAPTEDVDGAADAGGVWFLGLTGEGTAGGASSGYTQNSPGVSGTAEAGDRFGTSLSMRGGYLAVGVPDENVRRRIDAGIVHTFRQAPSGGLRQLGARSQDSAGVPGAAEAGDRFGAAVAAAVAPACTEALQVAIGAPGEDFGRRTDAGTVSLLNLAGGSCPAVVLGQGKVLAGAAAARDRLGGADSLGGAAESGDRFGGVIAAGPGSGVDEDYLDRLLFGVPQESIGAQRTAGLVLSTLPLYVNGKQVPSLTFSRGVLQSFQYGQVLGSTAG